MSDNQNRHTDSSIYIEEVHAHKARKASVLEFTHSATKAAGIMLLAAVVALVFANSPLYGPFEHAIHLPVGFVVGESVVTMSAGHVINDVFMAIFFLLVGLEIKYEMTVGELTNIRQALLPIVAAAGGVVMPIAIYMAFNAGNAETAGGWGIPTATDIAFALGIMALLGNRIPAGIRVFLSTLAVADDIIAILVIAIFYGQAPSLFWLAAAAAVLAVLIACNRSHVYSIQPYLGLGVVLWFCVFMSGVHSTIAGVLLAFTIPSGSNVKLRDFATWSREKISSAHESFNPDEPVIGQKDYMHDVKSLSDVARQVIPPATRMEHALYPWVYFAILPLFALTNADVHLIGSNPADFFSNPVLYGVFFGLLLGKPAGIVLFSFIVVKSRLASLPEHVGWGHVLGAAILGGVGFTMSIFVANLAFDSETAITTAKAAILAASTVAGVLGFFVLWLQARRDAARGVVYVMPAVDEEMLTQSDVDAFRTDEALLEQLDEESRRAIDEECRCAHPHEVVAHLR
ncbi:Na+/H+ antiporter NhaA [Slackia heliotrinireducens]|uniref:Na+/H+ antiporter NhaA n=1 Tax=Slackia heliotrinireducens TaxID=84110 RepID=UPI0033159575